MPSSRIFARHTFGGGWASDFSSFVDISPDESGRVVIPFLENADNVVFLFNGGPRKAPGTTKLNSTALESGADIRGLFDYWIQGSGGAPAQHRIVHVSTKIKKDDADGSFSDIFTGMTDGTIPNYFTFDDILIISQSGSDVPRSWDGTTAQNLAGTPPNFSFGVSHKNRAWGAGVDALPSRLYYSVALDPEDWVNAGSGSIDIDPDDGDRITGIISHKNELWVFKGPYKGSIHRITGSSNTGDDAFARKTFVEGIGAVWQNSIFRFGSDVGFLWSDGSVHSLTATDAFGDFKDAALSRPIAEWILEHVNFGALDTAWAENFAELGIVQFCIPIDAATTPNTVINFDYRFQPVRWHKWPSFKDTCICLASVIDSGANNRRIVMAGGTDGFVRKYGQKTRSIDGDASINYKVTTPFMTYGLPLLMKGIYEASIGIKPKTSAAITFGYTRDTNAQQTTSTGTINVGAVLGSFVLDTDMLGTGNFIDHFFEIHDGDDFRSIQYELVNNENNVDLEIHSFGANISSGAASTEN